MATADPSKVIISPGSTGNVIQQQAYHHDFPEIRAEGENSVAAATQLVNHLTRALDSALTAYRREAVETAIADVQAYIQKP